MIEQERRGWLIVASLFVGLLTVYGATIDSFGVFFLPLVREFGWSHARVSMLPSAFSVSPLLALPLAGWLLDRIEARYVIGSGILITGISLLGVSQAHSFGLLLVLFFLIGIGAAFCGFMSVSVVVANWFTERRATATGIALAGSSAGGAVMIVLANYVMARGGWRIGYIVLSLPLFFISGPLALTVLRSRPGSGVTRAAEPARHLSGINLRTAIRLPSIWLMCFAQFTILLVAGCIYVHTVPYVVSLHYSERYAAFVTSIESILIGVGKIAAGPVGDNLGYRVSLMSNLLLQTVLLGFLLATPSSKSLTTIAIWLMGIAMGGALPLLPALLAENVGLKEFGSISGLVWLCGTFGQLSGPWLAGWLFDLSGSYADLFKTLLPFCALAAIAIYGCSARKEAGVLVPAADVE